MSFVRNDLMLRHGRLKHKANLKGSKQDQSQSEPLSTSTPSPDGLHTLASVLPDKLDTQSIDLEGFSALDPALYAPWSLPDFAAPTQSFLDPLPAFSIPDTHQLLKQNGFRDVLIIAAQAMSQPPKIPSSSSLNRYVSLFIEKFLPHSPLLPPSFNVDTANPLLLISMASIGALYGVERKTALMLHTLGKNLEENLRSSLGFEEYPLWGIQSLYLTAV
jgi:hypothetical protein